MEQVNKLKIEDIEKAYRLNYDVLLETFLKIQSDFFQIKLPPALLNCSLKDGKLVFIESDSLI